MTVMLPSITNKPWGYELLFALTQKYAGKLIFVKQGHRLSFQYHNHKDESMYIHQGKVLVELENTDGYQQIKILNSGDCIHLAPLTKHRIKALEDTNIFEVSTPELDDVVRLADDYNRIT